MGRRSTRTAYTDPKILADLEWEVCQRDYCLFKDWVSGMTGGELAKKYYIADITARQTLTKCKRKYDAIKEGLQQ